LHQKKRKNPKKFPISLSKNSEISQDKKKTWVIITLLNAQIVGLVSARAAAKKPYTLRKKKDSVPAGAVAAAENDRTLHCSGW
jgi:hypothetical protein